MKAWGDLTERGQARRLRSLVENVLPEYGLAGAGIRLLEVATNIVYRIDHPARGRYVLKVDVTDEHPDEHVDLTLDWLAALNAGTDIALVEPVPTLDGDRYLTADSPGVPPRRRCVLYRWAPGRPVFDKPTSTHYHELGRITARLHEHAAGFRPSAPPNRWDRVFYFPGEPIVIHDPTHANALTPARRRLVEDAIEAVTPVLAGLYDEPGRMIHADLHGWNVLVSRGRMTVLDFDDAIWGQPIHDIAITFGYYREHTGYQDWIDAYEEGYRTAAAWPLTNRVDEDPTVRALMVARRLMFTNYVLQLPGDWSEELTAWMATFEEYLRGDSA